MSPTRFPAPKNTDLPTKTKQKSLVAPDAPTGKGLLALFWPLPSQTGHRANAS